MKTELSTKCQDCQFWCKEGVGVSHRAIFTYNQAMKDFSVGISLMETSC
ncbi:putative transformation protein [Streptococcus pneumoniae GA16833]|nr:putative transformation protein [Streptococcus pneumoniae GA16833]